MTAPMRSPDHTPAKQERLRYMANAIFWHWAQKGGPFYAIDCCAGDCKVEFGQSSPQVIHDAMVRSGGKILGLYLAEHTRKTCDALRRNTRRFQVPTFVINNEFQEAINMVLMESIAGKRGLIYIDIIGLSVHEPIWLCDLFSDQRLKDASILINWFVNPCKRGSRIQSQPTISPLDRTRDDIFHIERKYKYISPPFGKHGVTHLFYTNENHGLLECILEASGEYEDEDGNRYALHPWRSPYGRDLLEKAFLLKDEDWA